MSSFIDSVVNATSKFVNAVGCSIEKTEKDNAALIEKANTVAAVANIVLTLSVLAAIAALAIMPSLSVIPIIGIIGVTGYLAYEVSNVAKNIKNYVNETFFFTWVPEKSLSENLHLYSPYSRTQLINEITKDAPLANWWLKFLCK